MKMVSSRRIRVHESLIDQFGRIGKPIAEKIKAEYGLSVLTLDYPTISELAAGKLANKKEFNFKVHKISRDRGVLVLL